MFTLTEQRQHRQELVDVLRDGNYRQARKELRVGDGYCCLGVACDISGLGAWEWREGHWLYLIPHQRPMSAAVVLPEKVMDYYGFAHADAMLVSDDGPYATLAEANDDGVSFLEIAAMIENNEVRLEVRLHDQEA